MPKVVKSLRVEPELWASVEAFGKSSGLKTNAAAEILLLRGLAAKAPSAPVSSANSPLRMPKARPGTRLKTKVGRSKWVLFN